MLYSGAYAVAGRDIVFESFDGDSVVLDLATGKYFGFSDSGSGVWEALSAKVPLAELAGTSIGGAVISAAEIEGFVTRLIDFNLLVPAPDQPGEALPAEIAARLAGAREPLKVDVYEDLADLVLVDPIHDVDEPIGWPAVRQVS